MTFGLSNRNVTDLPGGGRVPLSRIPVDSAGGVDESLSHPARPSDAERAHLSTALALLRRLLD